MIVSASLGDFDGDWQPVSYTYDALDRIVNGTRTDAKLQTTTYSGADGHRPKTELAHDGHLVTTTCDAGRKGGRHRRSISRQLARETTP